MHASNTAHDYSFTSSPLAFVSQRTRPKFEVPGSFD